MVLTDTVLHKCRRSDKTQRNMGWKGSNHILPVSVTRIHIPLKNVIQQITFVRLVSSPSLFLFESYNLESEGHILEKYNIHTYIYPYMLVHAHLLFYVCVFKNDLKQLSYSKYVLFLFCKHLFCVTERLKLPYSRDVSQRCILVCQKTVKDCPAPREATGRTPELEACSPNSRQCFIDDDSRC